MIQLMAGKSKKWEEFHVPIVSIKQILYYYKYIVE